MFNNNDIVCGVLCFQYERDISFLHSPINLKNDKKKKIVKGLDLLDYCVYAWKHDDRLTLISVVILTGRPSTLMLAGNCPYKMNKANVCFK